MYRWNRRWQNFKHWLEDSKFLTSGFVAGLPAVIFATATVVVCLIARQAQLTKTHVSRYAKAVDAAVADDDEHTQKLFLRKLISDEPDNAMYKLALVKTPGFDPESANRTIEQLAPNDRHGFAPAHLMRATKIAKQSILTTRDLTLIKHHASEALNGQIEKLGNREKSVAEAHGLLGYALSRGGDNTAALPHLKKAAEVLRHYRLPAARLSALMGNRDEAEQFGLMAERDYKSLMMEDPSDIAMRLEFVQSQMFLGKYQSAVQVLSEGNYEGVNEETKQFLIRIYLALWDVRVSESPASIAGRIRLLQSALSISPGHAGVLQRLTKIVTEDPESSTIARRVLQQQLVRGDAPASVHLMLGLAALRARESESATFHLQQAARLEPNSEQTIAALALSYVKSNQPDPQEALRLIESLPDFSFEDPEIRGIRGQILLSANRIPEAINDLENALKEIPKSVDIREALHEIYVTKGKTQLAELHSDVLKNRRQRPSFTPVMESSVMARSIQESKIETASHEDSKVETASHQEPAPLTPDSHQQPILTQKNFVAKALSVSLLPKRLSVSHFRTVRSRAKQPSRRRRSGNRETGS